MIHRKRPEQHLIEHREDRRVGPDPECQGKDGYCSDKWGLEERSEGELQVAHRKTRRWVRVIGYLVRAAGRQEARFCFGLGRWEVSRSPTPFAGPNRPDRPARPVTP